MAKYKVEYPITGNYTVNSNAIIDPSDETGLTEIEESRNVLNKIHSVIVTQEKMAR